MTITAIISQSDLAAFEQATEAQIMAAKVKAEDAMMEAFYGAVEANFGAGGLDRPWEWAPLSDRSPRGRAYILKVGRSYATLYVTGALAASIKKTPSSGDGASVSMDNSEVSYATRHHTGDSENSLPARRVFPIDINGECLPYTEAVVLNAAREAFMDALN